MADEAGTHYEDIINEMTLGHKYIFDQFGVRPKVGWHIDPFGHSNQVSTLYSQMGFDAFSIYRIHHDDVDKRMADKNLEFVWRGSKSLDKESDIFWNYLDTGYKAPDECELFSQYGGGVQYTVDDDRWVQWDEDLPTYAVSSMQLMSIGTRPISNQRLTSVLKLVRSELFGMTMATTC